MMVARMRKYCMALNQLYDFSLSFCLTACLCGSTGKRKKNNEKKKKKHQLIVGFGTAAVSFLSSLKSNEGFGGFVGNFLSDLLRELILLNSTLTYVCLWELLK